MIVDAALARIGSANFSHRSMGVDTECDLAVDAAGDPSVGAGILRIRDRLLGEHLGLSAEAVAGGIGRGGSIAALIDARANADQTLVRIDVSEQVTAPSAVLQNAADPDDPVAFGS